MVAARPVAVTIWGKYSKAGGTGSTTAASATPGVIEVCAGPLRANGNGFALYILASSVVFGMHSIIAGEVLAPPVGLHGRIFLGKACTLEPGVALILAIIDTGHAGEACAMPE